MKAAAASAEWKFQANGFGQAKWGKTNAGQDSSKILHRFAFAALYPGRLIAAHIPDGTTFCKWRRSCRLP